MSTPLSHAYPATLVLLLAVCSIVCSLQKKTSSHTRENPAEQGKNFHSNDKVRHLTHRSQYTEVPEKLFSYENEDIVSENTKAVFGKDTTFASSKEKDYGSTLSRSESFTESKFDDVDTKQTESLKSNKDISTDVKFHNQPMSLDSDTATPSDLGSNNEFTLQVKQDGGNAWGSSYPVDDSSESRISSVEESRISSVDYSPVAMCTTCRMREIDRHYRIMNFKQQILNSLQMKNLPNTTGVPIPKVPALAHLYVPEEGMMSDSPYRRENGLRKYKQHMDYGDFVVKTERVFITAKQAPIGQHLNKSDIVLFPPSSQLFSSKIKTAHLWIYIRKHEDSPTYLTIDKILPETIPAQKLVKTNLYFQKLTRQKDFGWKRFNMRETLRQWVEYPMGNVGLQIRAEAKSGTNLIVLPPSQATDRGYEPWLETKIMEPRSNSRRRRSESLLCVENSTDSRCCRHPLLVGFAEFGWDWIIAPTHVKADYCTGECRLTMQDNTPYSWVNQQMPGSNTCCTPTKLSPLPLLYFDESMDIVYTILQNMKVDKCGCA